MLRHARRVNDSGLCFFFKAPPAKFESPVKCIQIFKFIFIFKIHFHFSNSFSFFKFIFIFRKHFQFLNLFSNRFQYSNRLSICFQIKFGNRFLKFFFRKSVRFAPHQRSVYSLILNETLTFKSGSYFSLMYSEVIANSQQTCSAFPV